VKKILRKLALTPIVATVFGLSSAAHADIWSYSFTDLGVEYTLTFESLSGNVGTFTLTLDTTGYDQQPDGFLDSVDIKAWDGLIGFDFTAPTGTSLGTSNWIATYGPISSGPASNTGCKDTGSGFACLEAETKGIFDVDLGKPYTFTFEVTADSFLSEPFGGHIGAGYADSSGEGSGYGITSHVAAIPEPEIYAMLAAGLGLMIFVARRRKQQYALA
jgi:hypothetical protein